MLMRELRTFELQRNCKQTMPFNANRTNLFEDNTADEFISGMTVGLFNYASGSTIRCITWVGI